MKSSVIIASFLFIFGHAWSQEELSLIQAQQYGIQNAFSVQSAKLDLQKANERVKEIKAIGLPQVNAQGSFQNFLDVPVQVLPDFISPSVYGVLIQSEVLEPDYPVPTPTFVEAQFGTSFTASGTIQASQLIFDGSYLIGLKAIQGVRELSTIAVEKNEEEIKQTITEAYNLCLASAENIMVLSESKVILEKTLSDTEILYENGFVEQQDVEQLQLSMKSLKNQILYANNQQTIALQLLKFQMGMDQANDIKLTSSIEDLVSSSLAAGSSNVSFDINNDVDYRLAMTNKNLMVLDLKNKKSGYLPSLNAFFSYQRTAQRNEFNFFDGDESWFPSTVWGLNLNIPIFSSGMRKSQVAQAQIELDRADLFLKQAEQGAKLELTSAKNDMYFAVDNYQTAMDSKDLAKRIFDKTQIKYNEGISSSFELTQAKDQLLQAQRQYVSAVVTLLNSSNALNKALNIY